MDTVSETLSAKYLANQQSTLQNSSFVDWAKPDVCCSKTIDTHAHINPIMVCGTCKHIIKCFSEERAFKNFLMFCHSRGRKVRATEYGAYFVAIYQSHGNVK